MSQELQQGAMEIKKPRMYVSWRIIPLDFLVVVLMANVLSVLLSFREVWGIGLFLPLSILPIGIILLLIIAISKKPMGYISRRIINSVFLLSVLIPAPFLLIVGTFGGGLGGHNYFFAILGYIIFSVAGVCVTFVLNRKFQKSEFELIIT